MLSSMRASDRIALGAWSRVRPAVTRLLRAVAFLALAVGLILGGRTWWRWANPQTREFCRDLVQVRVQPSTWDDVRYQSARWGEILNGDLERMRGGGDPTWEQANSVSSGIGVL